MAIITTGEDTKHKSIGNIDECICMNEKKNQIHRILPNEHDVWPVM